MSPCNLRKGPGPDLQNILRLFYDNGRITIDFKV